MSIEQLGNAAIGTIGPGARVEAGEITMQKINELARRLSTDEFYEAVGGTSAPNAAGGTFSLVVADALTTNSFRGPGQTAKEHATTLYAWLLNNKNDAANRKIIPRICVDGRLPIAGSLPNNSIIGGHDDEGGPAGCGAQKRLAEILNYVAKRSEDLRRFAVAHGVKIDDTTHDEIVKNAHKLLKENYISSGVELRAALVGAAGATSVTTLAGEHREVVGLLNNDPTKTLNRIRLRDAFGEAYGVFAIDVGVFNAAANVISKTKQEAHEKFMALMYFNIATTTVLADASLRIVEHGDFRTSHSLQTA